MNETDANQSMDQKCPQCGAPLPSGVLAGLCPACLLKQGAAADTAVAPEAAPFQPPGVEKVARLFPQLEIIAFIGKGGMGAVYQARQPALDRMVALKILPPQTASGTGFVERFNREARALAKLNHPNIVAVYEFGQVERPAVLHHGICGWAEPAASWSGPENFRRARRCRLCRRFARRSNSRTTKGSCIATSSRRTSCSTKRAG